MLNIENKLWNVSGERKRQCKKVNLGCGNQKWPNFINVDVDQTLNPDITCDIRFNKLPIVEKTITEAWMCHTIEHIQKIHWPAILFEVSRILQIGGIFYVTYPEFLKCVELWQANYLGKKDYYEACIYGRQASVHDFHVTICHTPDMIYMFKQYGFGEFVKSQELEPQYSALKMVKLSDTFTKEDMLRKEIFDKER